MDEDRMALREIGERLFHTSHYRKSTSKGRSELLGLLRSGKLAARFDFPSNERPQIQIPAAYWQDVKTGEFRKALDSTRSNKGDYVVSVRLFTNEYLIWFLQKQKLPKHADELSAALRASTAKAEAYVLAKDFEQFIAQEDLDTTLHSNRDQKSNRGKSENPNWSAILVEVAVELLNASQGARPLTKAIAADALRRVTPRGNTQLPIIGTVEKKVDEIIHRYWKS